MKKILACLAAAALLAGAYGVRIVNAGITCTLPFQLQNNTTADATQVMANYNALVTCFTNAAAAGVNNDITALIGLTTPLAPASGGTASYYGTGGGIAASQSVASLAPTGFTLATGRRVTFKPSVTNVSAVTLNVNGGGAVAVWRNTPYGAGPTVGGELTINTMVTVVYDGTRWVIEGTMFYPGTIADFAGPDISIPAGWIVAQGSTLPVATFPQLYAALGNTYGGDASNIGIPDLRGRGTAAVDNGSARATNCGGGTLAGSCGVGSTALSKAMIDDFVLNTSVLGVSISDPGHTHDISAATTPAGAITGFMQPSTSSGLGNQPTQAAATGISASLTGAAFTGGGGAGLSLWTPALIVQKIIKL